MNSNTDETRLTGESDDFETKIANLLAGDKSILELIEAITVINETEKQKYAMAYADKIIGDLLAENIPVSFSRIIQNECTAGISQIDRQKCYNELIANQLKSNKSKRGKI